MHYGEFEMCTHAIELAYTKAAELANLEVQECVWDGRDLQQKTLPQQTDVIYLWCRYNRIHVVV